MPKTIQLFGENKKVEILQLKLMRRTEWAVYWKTENQIESKSEAEKLKFSYVPLKTMAKGKNKRINKPRLEISFYSIFFLFFNYKCSVCLIRLV